MKILALLCLTLTLGGCMMPNYSRIVPETKSARVRIVSIYGYIEIDTRVQGDPNTLDPLPKPPKGR